MHIGGYDVLRMLWVCDVIWKAVWSLAGLPLWIYNPHGELLAALLEIKTPEYDG
jgi:hypothetical protein